MSDFYIKVINIESVVQVTVAGNNLLSSTIL